MYGVDAGATHYLLVSGKEGGVKRRNDAMKRQLALVMNVIFLGPVVLEVEWIPWFCWRHDDVLA